MYTGWRDTKRHEVRNIINHSLWDRVRRRRRPSTKSREPERGDDISPREYNNLGWCMRRSLPGHWRESLDDKDDKTDTESYHATLPSNLSHNIPKPVEGIEIPATHSIHMVINWLTAVWSILRFRFKASLGPTIIGIYLLDRTDDYWCHPSAYHIQMQSRRASMSSPIGRSFTGRWNRRIHKGWQHHLERLWKSLHINNDVTRRSHTGILIFVNSALVVQYSKKQNTIESATFGAEMVAMSLA